MIYQFTGKCNESPDFQINVGMDAGHTFYDLHHALQSTLGFHSWQPATFFIPGNKGHQIIEITQLRIGNKNRSQSDMHNTLIGDIMKFPVKFICYIFDFQHDRSINLQLTGTYMEKNLREPSVTLNRGDIPVQTMDDVMTGELFDLADRKTPDPNHGLLEDYYEIFGEMEEYVL